MPGEDTGTSDSERCGYVFDIHEWERTHDGDCHLDPDDDAEILTEREGSLIWECPHQPIDGTDRCVFHPRSNDASPSGDAAAEFQAIVDGERDQPPLRFIGARFEDFTVDCDTLGDEAPIDLRHAQVDRLHWNVNTVTSPIDARGITIDSEAEFKQATFEGVAHFEWATFEGVACFDGATFESVAHFDGATFEGAIFNEATLEGVAHFGEAMFRSEADFEWATFEGVARFDEATFEGVAFFYWATFRSKAEFDWATFEDSVGFDEATFEDVANFDEARFEREVEFIDAVFLGAETSFYQARFAEDVSFELNISSQMLPSHIFAQSVFFTGVTVHRTLNLRIIDADENVITGELATFGGDVDFTDATIRNARLDGVSFVTEQVPSEDAPAVTFADADMTDTSLRSADFADVNLRDADLTNATCRGATFSGATLKRVIFSRANLYEADFTNARLYGALFGDARISDGTTFIDAGSWWTWVPFVTRGMQTVLDDPRTSPTNNSVADPEETIDPRSRAASIYAQLETLARENARTQLASTCFRWRKDMERDRYWSDTGAGTKRQPARALLATLTNALTRYGDSPWRVVGWSGIVILLSTVLLQVATRGIQPSACSACEPVTDPLQLLYFSAVTFTTLGYGDYQPAGAGTQLIASVESVLGALLVALLVAVLGRRATR
jgi:uncharacterized protein YjbI with pentapeptide repeats